MVVGVTALSEKQIEVLARADGFRGLCPSLAFFEFFGRIYGPRFAGELIMWKPTSGTRRTLL